MNQEIDNQLLLDVLNKNKKSEKIFIDLCNPIIWGALKRFDQLSYEDKEDLIQNIIIKDIYGKECNWSGIKKFRGDSKFTTYLYRITTYRALDFIKSKGMKYKSKTDSTDDVRINIASEGISIDNQIALNDALLILKSREREIVKLASEGYKHREIADKFNTSTNNVSSILSRAYGKMKKYMQEKQ